MGKMKQHPRYNILSVRISDAVLLELVNLYPEKTSTEILSEALADKIVRDRQASVDNRLRAAGIGR